MAGAREIIAGRAAIIVRADDQTGGGLKGVEAKVQSSLARMSVGIGRAGVSGGGLTSVLGQVSGGFGRLAATAGPAGIAAVAALGGALVAANKLVEVVQRGAEVIRKLSEEAQAAGVSVSQLTGGRITDEDVQRIELMDSAAGELKQSIDLAAASIASGFAPAVTRLATALSVAVDVAAEWGGHLSEILGILVQMSPLLVGLETAVSALSRASGGSGDVGADLDDLAKLKQQEAESKAAIARAEARHKAAQEYRRELFQSLEAERDMVGLTEQEARIRKEIDSAKAAGVGGADVEARIAALIKETDLRKEQKKAEQDAAAAAAAAVKDAQRKTEEFEKQVEALKLETELVGKSTEEQEYRRAIAAGLEETQARELAAAKAALEARRDLQKATEDQAAAAVKAKEAAEEEAKRKAENLQKELDGLRLEAEMVGRSVEDQAYLKALAEGKTETEAQAIRAATAALERRREMEKAAENAADEQERKSDDADRLAEQIKESLKTPEEKFNEFTAKLEELVNTGRLTADQALAAEIAENAKLAGDRANEATNSRTSAGTFNPAALMSLVGSNAADRTAKATEASAKSLKNLENKPAGLPVL